MMTMSRLLQIAPLVSCSPHWPTTRGQGHGTVWSALPTTRISRTGYPAPRP